MSKAVSCNCGWHAHGTEEELVEAFVQHVKGHGEQISREQAAARIVEEER